MLDIQYVSQVYAMVKVEVTKRVALSKVIVPIIEKKGGSSAAELSIIGSQRM